MVYDVDVSNISVSRYYLEWCRDLKRMCYSIFFKGHGTTFKNVYLVYLLK